MESKESEIDSRKKISDFQVEAAFDGKALQ
jgi:hypothetical protein